MLEIICWAFAGVDISMMNVAGMDICIFSLHTLYTSILIA